MSYTVTGRLIDHAKLWEYTQKKIADACLEAARFVPRDQARRIAARITPDGGSQKANAAETRKQKRRALGHDIPLRGHERLLVTPSAYGVRAIKEGAVVSVPVGRADVVVHLRARGYQLFEVSRDLTVYLQALLREALRLAEAAVPRFYL